VAHGFHGLTYELDGVPLPRGTSANFSEVIDPRDIDSLEVFTGAFPAEFGGSRQGAVVNIITRRATDLTAPKSGSLTLGGATYGSAQVSLDESVRLGNTRVFLNGNLERTNRGIDSPTFVPVNDRSNQSNEFLRTITNVGKTDSLAFDFANNFAQFQIPINQTVNPNDPVLQVPGTGDVQREYDRFVNLVYTNNAKNGDSYTQIAPWYHDDRVVYAGDLPSDLLGTIDNGDGTFTGLDGLAEDRRSTFLGVRLTHFHTFGPNAVKAGIDASNEFFVGNERIAYLDQNGGLQNFFDNQRQRGSQFGAYIQDKWTPTSALAVSGGLRFDHSTGYVAGAAESAHRDRRSGRAARRPARLLRLALRRAVARGHPPRGGRAQRRYRRHAAGLRPPAGTRSVLRVRRRAHDLAELARDRKFLGARDDFRGNSKRSGVAFGC